MPKYKTKVPFDHNGERIEPGGTLTLNAAEEQRYHRHIAAGRLVKQNKKSKPKPKREE
ncbi:MAG: hypothetical protein GTO41_22955 [Burkholderiales bacterium]|nr:hypothetical protein [Burkholderiales bacterium]